MIPLKEYFYSNQRFREIIIQGIIQVINNDISRNDQAEFKKPENDLEEKGSENSFSPQSEMTEYDETTEQNDISMNNTQSKTFFESRENTQNEQILISGESLQNQIEI